MVLSPLGTIVKTIKLIFQASLLTLILFLVPNIFGATFSAVDIFIPGNIDIHF